MEIPEIEAALLRAQHRMLKASQALAPKHKGREWEEYWAANTELLKLERELAAAKGEQHAVPIDFPLRWDAGAPLPHLLQNDHKTYLIFLLRDDLPKSKDSESPRKRTLGIVEFKRCMATRMGAPNDEVFHGHPLSGKGLEAYGVQQVIHSEWIESLQAINSVHNGYNPDSWRKFRHYVFWFHDSSFECVVESFDVWTSENSLREQLAILCDRLTQ